MPEMLTCSLDSEVRRNEGTTFLAQGMDRFLLPNAFLAKPIVQPNATRDIKQGIARWDALVSVPDPDALAAEFASRGVEFFTPLQDTDDGLRGFEIKDADGYILFFGRPR